MLTPAECIAARKLLGWSRDRLAPRCGISGAYLARFESRMISPGLDTLQAIRAALEEAGVEFGPEEGDGTGLRLREQPET